MRQYQLGLCCHNDFRYPTIWESKVLSTLPPYSVLLCGMHIYIGPDDGHAHLLQMNLRKIRIYVIERRICGKQRTR